jgi:rod shape-determining protein MreC
MRRLTRRQRMATAVLLAISVLFISLDFAGDSLRNARGGTTGALGSLYRGTDVVLGPARRFVQGIPDVGRNRSQIAALKQQNDQLRRDLANAQLDHTTAQQLARLQLQARSAGWRTIPARVIATGPGSGFQWTVTVDVGSRDQVVTGQTVSDGVGLVGRVLAVYPTSSVVLLAADPTFGVGARDTRSGALLLATGNGRSGLTGAALDDKANLKVGDRLTTGPAGASTFVSGVPVGVITSVTTATDGSTSVSIRPTGAQTGLDLVGVVVSPVRDGARPALGSGQ